MTGFRYAPTGEPLGLAWRYFDIPLRVPFRGVTRRKGAVILGPHGWGECSPFPGFAPESRNRSVEAAYDAAFEPWPMALRTAIPVHVTIPAVAPEEAAALVRQSGCRAAKVKVAEGNDEARVEAVRDALGPGGRLVVDANGAWDFDQAVASIRRLSRYSVELVEQPVRGLADLARVRRTVDVPVAADELASSEKAIRIIARTEAADVVVVKVQAIGGVTAALRAVETAGIPAIVSNLLETSIGISAGVALAAALDSLPYPCGLGTVPLLAGDLVADSLVPVNGQIEVRRPEADTSALARFADPEPWWEGSYITWNEHGIVDP
ncbi:MAG TPA: o-succinylbenzoate synthase [Actinomycetota bacterium]|nr:o-succinylbenzoate synthase [Actinomycetota bacterium]